ncbi:hypothetical protein H7F33_18790 [Pedobacter sp. PAMC26386]|nr:hypothetical protein H7F33_18790 [Pedobacter sp. PAMC26386]
MDTKISGNHSFGVLLLKVDSVEKGKFIDTLLKQGIYPYKIRGGMAEVYTCVPYNIQKGTKVVVDSDKKTVFYHYIVENKDYKGNLLVVENPYDIEYANAHAIFKSNN